MSLSAHTVHTHVRRLFGKLGVGDRAAAAASDFRCGILH